MNWNDYPNFSEEEFDCKETGENEMKPEFMERLQRLRDMVGHPLPISSGYRSPRHSIEARKEKAGTHAQGIACDIACHSQLAHLVLEMSLTIGFTGIGVQQKGAKKNRFIHLDLRENPTVWSY